VWYHLRLLLHSPLSHSDLIPPLNQGMMLLFHLLVSSRYVLLCLNTFYYVYFCNWFWTWIFLWWGSDSVEMIVFLTVCVLSFLFVLHLISQKKSCSSSSSNPVLLRFMKSYFWNVCIEFVEIMKLASEHDAKYNLRSTEFSMRKMYGDLNWRAFYFFVLIFPGRPVKGELTFIHITLYSCF